MILIEHQEVGVGGAASITFSDIPQDYTDLYLLLSARSSGGGTYYAVIQPNGASASYRTLRGNGSTASSGTDPAKPYADITTASETANTFANITAYFPNYASTTTNKSYSIDGVTENNATTARQILGAALYASNTAITSIVISAADANLNLNQTFVQYSSATLYGITTGSDGITSVS